MDKAVARLAQARRRRFSVQAPDALRSTVLLWRVAVITLFTEHIYIYWTFTLYRSAVSCVLSVSRVILEVKYVCTPCL